MAPAGGIEVMLLLIGVSGAIFALVALLLRDKVGTVSAWAIAGFWWSLVVIAVVTLVPTEADVGIVSAEGRMTSCSSDIGGPAPDGFWIFAGGQRLLNTVVFIPAGVLLVLAASRWRIGWVLVPLGLVGLAAYSVVIEAHPARARPHRPRLRRHRRHRQRHRRRDRGGRRGGAHGAVQAVAPPSLTCSS